MKTQVQISVKDCFKQASMMNAKSMTVSSLGNIVTEQSRQIADFSTNEIKGFLPKESLAYTIVSECTGNFSEKQLWVVAYELFKNEEYKTKLAEEKEEMDFAEECKKASRRAKRQAKKEVKKQIEIRVDDNSSLVDGDKVMHAQFGEGIVVSNTEDVITIDFGGAVRRLLKSYAKLQKM